MLIQIIHTFQLSRRFHVLDVEFIKSQEYLNFNFLSYIILRLQMALHNI